MSDDALIHPGDTLEIITKRKDDGTNDGSIIVWRRPGHAYCIAKAPRYSTDAEWQHNAKIMVDAIRNAESFRAELERLLDVVCEDDHASISHVLSDSNTVGSPDARHGGTK